MLARDRLGRYVGLAAYEKAGGAVWRDLFVEDNDGVRLEDRALVDSLATAKLARKVATIEKAGWGWVRGDMSATDSWNASLGFDRSHPDGEETPAYRANAGCVVVRPTTAESLACCEGLVKRGAPAATGSGGAATGSGGKPARDPLTLSDSLRGDLSVARGHIVAAHLADDFGCAFDLVAYTLAVHLLVPRSLRYSGDAIERWLAEGGDRDREAPEWTRATQIRAAATDGLPMAWADLANDEPRFATFCALSGADREAIFAAAVACLVRPALPGAELDGYEEICARLGIAWSTFRPDVPGYWSRLSKAQILDQLAGAFGATSDVVIEAGKLKKKELAELAGERLGSDGDAPEWVLPAFKGEK